MIVRKMMMLFQGLDRAYVLAPLTQTETVEGQKVETKVKTVHESVVPTTFANHIEGKDNLGIIPIKDNGKVSFAVIDIDDYSISFPELEKKLKKLKLPLIITRSKSGGAHLYLFLEHEIKADFVVKKMKIFALALGYSYEIFPKQTRLASERDVGNGISLPYFNGNETTRYAYRNGKKLTIEAFLKLAETMKVDKDKLATYEPDVSGSGEFSDSPPCIQMLVQSGGVKSGTRNNALFSFGILAKKKFGDDWREKMETWNHDYFSPPVNSKEVVALQNSLSKEGKDYFYKCTTTPLCDVCNKDECRKRDYGIGDQDQIPFVIEELTKFETDPPLYIAQINDQRIEISSKQLLSYAAFRVKVFESLDFLPPQISSKQWEIEVTKLLEKMNIVAVPQSSTPQGKLVEMLERYCTGTAKTDQMEGLITGGVFVDGETTMFRMTRFEEFLERSKFREVPKNKIINIVKDRLGGIHSNKMVKKRCISVFEIPTFPEYDKDTLDKTKDEF